MKISFSIFTKGLSSKVLFGIAETSDIENCQKFRYQNYLDRGYIHKNIDQKDLDQYDDYSVFFVAKYQDEIIGFARLIIRDPLPTEQDCFDFKEPESMRNVSRENRGELSRLIVSWPSSKPLLPRHLVMLGLYKLAIDYSYSSGLQAGYGFIKLKLKKKLDYLNFPIHYINEYSQKYSGGVLDLYFKDKNDPVYPIYYFINELKDYVDSLFESRFVFLRNGGDYILRSTVRLKLKILGNVFIK